MMSRHYRTIINEAKYGKHLRATRNSVDCPFCSITSSSKQLISESQHFKVIYNIFPYNKWDYSNVTEHLLLIPKQHTDNLGTLPPAAMQEFVELISKYESIGYDIFARSPHSKSKTVKHQHTHLIKTTKTSSN
jgi:diadenosine tetraphosphate (Ap4A) HIT family hydrolase